MRVCLTYWTKIWKSFKKHFLKWLPVKPHTFGLWIYWLLILWPLQNFLVSFHHLLLLLESFSLAEFQYGVMWMYEKQTSLVTHFVCCLFVCFFFHLKVLGSKGTSSVISNEERKQLFSNIFAVRDSSERFALLYEILFFLKTDFDC